MARKMQVWVLLAGVIIAGLGAIALAIASLAASVHSGVFIVCLLLVIGGGAMTLSAMNARPLDLIARLGLGSILQPLLAPFRWYAREYRRQWSAPIKARKVKSAGRS